MSSLIKQESGFVEALTMSSREIADLTNKQHAHVMRDIRAMLVELEQNPKLDSAYKTSNYIGSNGQSYPQYELDKDLTLTLMLGYDTAARFKVVQRWQELEQKEVAPVVNPAQLSRMQLIQLAMEAEEEKLALEAKVEEQAPKVEALERIAEAEGALTLTDAAKVLQQPPLKFNDWLHSKDWIYRRMGRSRNQWTAYQTRIKSGHLTHKIRYYPDPETGESKVSEQVMVTPKGIAKLSEMLNLRPIGSTLPLKPNAYLEVRG